jgi:hypothetical protein
MESTVESRTTPPTRLPCHYVLRCAVEPRLQWGCALGALPVWQHGVLVGVVHLSLLLQAPTTLVCVMYLMWGQVMGRGCNDVMSC